MYYKINKGFIVQKLDGKTTIFDGEESVLYTFNETASLVFQKIKAAKSKEEIIESFVKKYGIKEERAEKDVGELIGELKKKGIVKSVMVKKPVSSKG